MEIGLPDGVLDDPAAIAETVHTHDAVPVRGTLDEVIAAEPAVMLVEGDDGLLGAIEAGQTERLLPIAASRGVEPVPRDRLADALEALIAGEGQPVARGGVQVGGESVGTVCALFDAMLMTAEPATISEYVISTDEEAVARYRADGVVMAGPTGSGGYARAAGGAVCAPAIEVLSVVPISPYRTDDDHWVLDHVTIEVVRDETDVTLYADDERIDVLLTGSTIEATPTIVCETIRLPQSRSVFSSRP